VPLHVPGHKRGRGVHPKLREALAGGGALACDLTELAGLDFLSAPSGPILEAQRLAARAFGAESTWFLVNGCSVGVHAAVMAACRPGGRVALARNCHLSAFAALALAGCEPLWVMPEQDDRHGVAHCVTPAALASVLDGAAARGQRVDAALVVSPTYFGAVADIPGAFYWGR